MSKRVAYYGYGDPEVLKIEEDQESEPGPDYVRVRNELIGVNPVDWKMVAGFFEQSDVSPFPHVPGWASTGVVEAVGSRVESFAVGDPVIVGARGGAYCQSLLVHAGLVEHRPAGLSLEQSAALPSSSVAGYSMIDNLDVTQGDVVLVHGAAGAVGSAAAQIALARGAQVIGTASPRNHEYLRSLHITPLDYGVDLLPELKKLDPVTASADAVGGELSARVTREVLPTSQRVVTAWGDQYSSQARIPWVHHPDDELSQTVKLAEQGKLVLRIGELFPLGRASDALTLSKTGHASGKILLDPNNV